MNVLFAAGPFDNPWIVAVLLIVGALVNWLTKRRAKKQAEQPQGDEPSAASGKPAGELDLEAALRRLMGIEPPAPVPAPPPLPGAARDELPPGPDWQEGEPYQKPAPTVPTSLPPPVPLSQAAFTGAAAGEQLQGPVRHPATVVGHARRHHSRAAGRTRWRDPRSARRAFVAAVVFAPPKSLEP